MAKKVMGTLKDYVTLDEAAMTLARMRMRRTVRNASREFLLRFFDAGAASENKCRARDYLPPRWQWARPGPRSRGKKNTGQLQVASIMRCIRAHEKFGTLEAKSKGPFRWCAAKRGLAGARRGCRSWATRCGLTETCAYGRTLCASMS